MSFSNYDLLSLHPITYVASIIIITTFVIGFTSPYSSIRLGTLPLIATATWRLLSTCSTDLPNVFWASLVSGNGLTYFLLYIELALLSKWNFDDRGPAPRLGEVATAPQKREQLDNIWLRFKFGFNAVLSQRRVGTAYEVKNVPAFKKGDPTYVPTKSRFLLGSLVLMVVCYLVVDASSLAAQPEMNEVFFAAPKIPLLSRIDQVTLEELAVRTMSCLTVALNVCCILLFGYYMLASITISLCLSEVKDWRPPFGSLVDVYTIRRFWGVLWHQMFRQTFSGPAKFIVEDFLKIPRRTKRARYTKMLLTFFISGLFHKLVDMAGGMTVQESGSLQFFCTQAFGIVIEDMAQAVYLYFSTSKTKPNRKSSPLWTRLLGYVWLATFLVWSSPVVIFPAIRRNRGEPKDRVIPFSILGLLLRT